MRGLVSRRRRRDWCASREWPVYFGRQLLGRQRREVATATLPRKDLDGQHRLAKGFVDTLKSMKGRLRSAGTRVTQLLGDWGARLDEGNQRLYEIGLI
jgi:hypothetical protein